MVEPSEELQVVFEKAIKDAKKLRHEYVTLEHLFFAMLCSDNFVKVLDGYGCKVDSMKEELNDHLQNKIDEIKLPDYVPTQNDVLMARVRTSGIVTERYNIDNTTFEMYDVGGQRNERKKWIHCFEGVTAVIFVAAISEYDQKLFEDGETNRMV